MRRLLPPLLVVSVAAAGSLWFMSCSDNYRDELPLRIADLSVRPADLTSLPDLRTTPDLTSTPTDGGADAGADGGTAGDAGTDGGAVDAGRD